MNPQSTSDQLITVPFAAIPLIMLQRLEVQGLGGKFHYTALGKIAYGIYEMIPFAESLYRAYTNHIETRLRGSRIAAEYGRVMQREFLSIVEWLPERPTRIVGIGPGVAGLEAYLARFYAGLDSIPEIVLVDQSRVDKVYYGFHEQGAAYNSLEVAAQLLMDNGQPEDRVVCVESSGSSDVESIRGVDVITSLISWGFHYPVQAYIDFAVEALAPNGCLILDVRKDTGGIERLKQAFPDTRIIMPDPKFDRVLCTKR